MENGKTKPKSNLSPEKRAELLKNRKIEAQRKRLINTTLVTDKERIAIAKNIRENATGVFARFSFYKDGYKKTLGILLFTFLTFIISFYYIYYALFIYKPESVYLPVNSVNQLIEPVPLSESFFEDNEVRKFAADAFTDLSNYNYVTVDNSYFTDISSWFTPTSFAKYKKDFKDSPEVETVKTNFFVVSEITVRDATINKEESEAVRKAARDSGSDVYLWVVNLKSRRVYQNRRGFTYDDYETRMIITRSPVRINERGLAIHSIVNEKISKK